MSSRLVPLLAVSVGALLIVLGAEGVMMLHWVRVFSAWVAEGVGPS